MRNLETTVMSSYFWNYNLELTIDLQGSDALRCEVGLGARVVQDDTPSTHTWDK
jgi:hypothetical protein